MALIRQVLQNTQTREWAYVEYSDEEEKVFTILGGMHFETEELAADYAKGFAIDSYEYVEPKEVKINILEREIVKAEEHLAFCRQRLEEVQQEQTSAKSTKKK